MTMIINRTTAQRLITERKAESIGTVWGEHGTPLDGLQYGILNRLDLCTTQHYPIGVGQAEL
jgi:hypothetical protein